MAGILFIMQTRNIGYIWRDGRMNLIVEYTEQNRSTFYRIFYKDKRGNDKSEDTYDRPKIDMYIRENNENT